MPPYQPGSLGTNISGLFQPGLPLEHHLLVKSGDPQAGAESKPKMQREKVAMGECVHALSLLKPKRDPHFDVFLNRRQSCAIVDVDECSHSSLTQMLPMTRCSRGFSLPAAKCSMLRLIECIQ